MSGDTEDSTKVQSCEEIKRAIHDANLSEGELVELEGLVQDCRKAKSSSKHRQNLREVPPPIISKEWRELDKEDKFKNLLMSKFPSIHQNMSPQLNPPLKLCLLSFAIFPENSIIKKRSLIYWWIGQGLVSQKGDKTAEEEGEEIYNELLKQGLIEPDDNDPSPLMNRCKMHPLIRYMLISVAEEAGFFYFKSKDKTPPEVPDETPPEVPPEVPDETSPEVPDETSREVLRKCIFSNSRLHLILGGAVSLPDGELATDGELAKDEGLAKDKVLAIGKDVSTVFNVNQQYLNLRPHQLSNVKQLAVLQLGRWQHLPKYHIEVDDQKFLNDLGVHHKHLKFLSLRGISRITALPDSIVKLVSLEILDLRACHNLEKLPEDIASLTKLTHLDVSECYLIERMPKGTEKLSSLQVLKGFVIGTARKSPCKISDLQKLTKLRRLSIYIGRGAAIGDEEFASLKKVETLCSLTISWGVTSLVMQSGPRFPPRLQKLEIIGIPVERIPEWLNPRELKDLKKLYIIGGKLDSLDHQQQNEQWSVEMLRLKHLKQLRIGNKEEVLKKFPRLKYFERIKCAENDIDILWYKNRAVK